jgi:hypothetical protein
MSKNTTRKGLAFGAGFALVASGLAGVPAQAAGLADKSFVSLAPLLGTEYSVLANGTFDLKANLASSISVSGSNLKFLVEDTSLVTKFDTLNVNSPSASPTAAAGFTKAVTTGTVFTFTGVTGSPATGSTILFTAAQATTLAGGIVAGTVYTITNLSGTSFTIDSTVASNTTAAGTTAALTELQITAAATIENRTTIVANALASTDTSGFPNASAGRKSTGDGTYVVDSGTHLVANDRVLRLVNTGALTQSVNVTAWVDANANGEIDSTEYTSDTRTVKFLANSGITTTTVLNPVSVGDATLVATITTSPVLNGNQVGNTSGVSAEFTRQGSSATVNAATTTWSDTTKAWTATSANLVASNWTDLTTPTTRVNAGGIGKVTVAATTGLVTVETDAVHNLLNGDLITFTVGSGDDGTDEILSAATVSAREVTVTGTSSFTYVTNAATITAGTIADATVVGTGYTIQTYGATVGLADRALAGTQTAKARLGATGSFVAVGSANSGAAAVRTASAISPDVVGGVNAVKTAATTSNVRTGTTEAVVVATITNDKGNPVAAGVNAVATISGITGTISVNGTKAANTETRNALTDASGQASFVVTNAAALAGNAITLTIASEGVAGVAEGLTWSDAVLQIVDLNDSSLTTTPVANRAVSKGGSYTYDLVVQDQFKKAADSSTTRLKAILSGRSVSQQIISLTAGKASVTIGDGGIATTGTTEVEMRIETLVGTTWGDPAVETSVANWDGTGTEDEAKSVINFYDQNDKITMNADAATNPAATAADLEATVVTKTLTAIDLRTGSGNPVVYATANKAVVSGTVSNSVTGVAKTGAEITLSGAGLLFTNTSTLANAAVYSVGSINVISNNGSFDVGVLSGTSGAKTVTVTVGGVSTTVKVTFTGIAGDAVLTVTTPGAVKPASTFQVKAKLADSFGNPLDTAAGVMKVTYTGAGIVFGTLPTETDANGELMFSVLLGSNDTGTVSVTVSYDQNADKDFVDAKDLNVTSTTVINASGMVASDSKVNVGSFNGKLVVYALNASGSEVSYKIAGKWVTQVVTSDSLMRYDRMVGATGVAVLVDIYVDGVKKLSKSVVTK